MTLKRVVGVTESPYSFAEQAFKWPGEAWMAEFDLPPIRDRAIAMEWIAFGLALQGKYGRFLFGDPSAVTPQGVATGTPLVDGGGQTGNVLNTKGWSNSITGILKAGDYIQLGTGLSSSLHMVVATSNSDGTGKAGLYIEPALRTSPADNAPIIVTNAQGVFRLDQNDFSWSIQPGPVWRISFTAREAISA